MLNRVLFRQYESSDMNKISHFSSFCLIQHSERWGSNKPYDLSYEHYASLFHPLEINSLYFSNRNATRSASSANFHPRFSFMLEIRRGLHFWRPLSDDYLWDKFVTTLSQYILMLP